MDIQDLSFQDGLGIRTTIFFKGCPLKCQWCSNPEGQNFFPEIMHNETLCKKCHDCINICPEYAITFDKNNNPIFNREKCIICKEKLCVDVCNNSALKISGEFTSTEEIMNKILPNMPFYLNSGGGLTLSGGEPLAQPEITKAILMKSLEHNLSVGVETCGYFKWNDVEDFVDKFDFIYFDLKCIDDKSYFEYTGVNEKIILENLYNLTLKNSSKIIITIPVIPDVNDSVNMMNKVIEICIKTGISKIRLLPYHSFGKGKYIDLGRGYKFNINRELNPDDLRLMRLTAVNASIECWIE